MLRCSNANAASSDSAPYSAPCASVAASTTGCLRRIADSPAGSIAIGSSAGENAGATIILPPSRPARWSEAAIAGFTHTTR